MTHLALLNYGLLDYWITGLLDYGRYLIEAKIRFVSKLVLLKPLQKQLDLELKIKLDSNRPYRPLSVRSWMY